MFENNMLPDEKHDDLIHFDRLLVEFDHHYNDRIGNVEWRFIPIKFNDDEITLSEHTNYYGNSNDYEHTDINIIPYVGVIPVAYNYSIAFYALNCGADLKSLTVYSIVNHICALTLNADISKIDINQPITSKPVIDNGFPCYINKVCKLNNNVIATYTYTHLKRSNKYTATIITKVYLLENILQNGQLKLKINNLKILDIQVIHKTLAIINTNDGIYLIYPESGIELTESVEWKYVKISEIPGTEFQKIKVLKNNVILVPNKNRIAILLPTFNLDSIKDTKLSDSFFSYETKYLPGTECDVIKVDQMNNSIIISLDASGNMYAWGNTLVM